MKVANRWQNSELVSQTKADHFRLSNWLFVFAFGASCCCCCNCSSLTLTMEIVIDNKSEKRKSALIVQAQRIDTDTHTHTQMQIHLSGESAFLRPAQVHTRNRLKCHGYRIMSFLLYLLLPLLLLWPLLLPSHSPSLLSTAVDLRLSCAVNLILMRICCPPAPILTHAWDIAYISHIVRIHCELLLIRK